MPLKYLNYTTEETPICCWIRHAFWCFYVLWLHILVIHRDSKGKISLDFWKLFVTMTCKNIVVTNYVLRVECGYLLKIFGEDIFPISLRYTTWQLLISHKLSKYYTTHIISLLFLSTDLAIFTRVTCLQWHFNVLQKLAAKTSLK